VARARHRRLNQQTEHTQEPEGETLELIKSKVSLDLELYQFGQTLFEQRFHEMTEFLVKEYAGPAITDSDQSLKKEVLYELLQNTMKSAAIAAIKNY